MKRSKAGLVLIIIGVVFIALAPIFKWGLGPMLVKLPDDIDSVSIYEGVLSLGVNPDTLELLPPGLEVKVPLTITRTDVSVPERSDGSTAVIREDAIAKGPGGKDFLTYTKYFALDRKTAKNVSSDEADVKDREGYSILFGFGLDKNEPLPVWDDDTGETGDITFVEETTLDGFVYKDLVTYVYEGGGEGKMLEPPLGLPEMIPGSTIKTLLGDPALPFNDDEEYKIDYVKTKKATVMINQRVGNVSNIPEFEEVYYVDASALGMGRIKLATLSYKNTAASVRASVDTAGDAYALLDLAGKWLPLGLLLFGVVILVIGLVVFVVKKPAA